MQLMIEFFALGAIGFYLAIGLISMMLTILLETDHPRFSAVCLIGLFWYMQWIKLFDVLAYAKDHPVGLVVWIVIYFALGAASLWPKWFGFVSDDLEEQADRVKKYDKKYDPGSLKDPEPSEHKEQIIAWAIYWPWSMFWFVVRHPLRRIGRAIYEGMERSLTNMSRSMTAKARKRLELKLKPKE